MEIRWSSIEFCRNSQMGKLFYSHIKFQDYEFKQLNWKIFGCVTWEKTHTVTFRKLFTDSALKPAHSLESGQLSRQIYIRSLLMDTKSVWLEYNLLKVSPILTKVHNISIQRRLLFWFWVLTISRDTWRFGTCWWFKHIIAVHQVAVILISCLCIHNWNIWNDRNWRQTENKNKCYFIGKKDETTTGVCSVHLLDIGLVGCDAKLMVASLKGPQPTLFLARTLYW